MFNSQVLAIIWVLIGLMVVNGQQTAETHAKIVNGAPIDIVQVPYVVSIRLLFYHNILFGLGHVCGGAVISDRVVCTAAHCFAINDTNPVEYREAEDFVVVAGGTQRYVKEIFTKVYLVQEIIGHKNFNPFTLENDIALLFLNGLIPHDYPSIRPLPLAEVPFKQGTLCLVTGWGNKQKSLHMALVPLVHQSLCNRIYPRLPSSQLCAGWMLGGMDACKGDSGGPLICQNTLAGIISWGIDCGRMYFPGVYTNISHLVNWIKWANSTLDYSKFLSMRSMIDSGNDIRYSINCYVVLSSVILVLVIQVA